MTESTLTLAPDTVALLVTAKEAREIGHQAIERSFVALMGFALKQAGVPEGAEFEITQHEDGTATVVYRVGEPAATGPTLVTDAEGAE